MIKQIFKMLWQDKKKYTGIFIEQILIFIVLLISMISVVSAIKKYNDPGLLNTNNTVVFGYMLHNSRYIDQDIQNGIANSMHVVVENLKKSPSVIAITKSLQFTPYLRGQDNLDTDSICIDNKKINVVIRGAEAETIKVFQPLLEEGKWLTDEVLEDGSVPAIITRQLADRLDWTHSVGKKVTMNNETVTIVGIISGIKENVFFDSAPSLILSQKFFDPSPEYREYAARLKPGTKSEFYNAFTHEFNRLISEKEVIPIFMDLDSVKTLSMQNTISQIAFKVIPTTFLFIFAFIGTFGVFWLYSQKRKCEFALRLATGSTVRQLIGCVIQESIIITSLATVPGLIIFYFVYELTLVNIFALCFTFIIMLLFSAFSAWIPAYQVSRVNPAETLHYE